MVKYVKISDFNGFMPFRAQNSNKGTFGRVLNIAGCVNYVGAAFLSSVSPLKVGAGLVTLAAPKSIIPSVAAKVSEITFIPLGENSAGAVCSVGTDLSTAVKTYDVVSVGCGLGLNSDTKEFLRELFNVETNAKWVMDADALNIISSLSLEKLPENVVLTPHPKEMSRLLKVDVEEINGEREKFAVECAEKFGATVLLKGQNTVVTDGTNVYINTTGSSALAKAGSGDVLTGIISGLIAQGVSPFEAACKGSYLHGLAGELAAAELSEYSILASDLIDFIPKAILKVLEN